ncbi:MAG: sugar ABC transporter ATP-binding protein [Armatimonadetes bacterium]|nr:sugar ABC transporter ATP-binding protein [Armatimonadota bacterium]
MSETLVRLEHIEKSFGANRVLNGVDLTVEAGEVHVLAGGNGAGKSTLINILGGAIQHYSGTVHFMDKPVHFGSPQDAIRQGISVIHQELSLVPDMSVLENLFLGDLPTRRGWVDFAAMSQQAKAVLARLGLEIDLQARVGSFPISTQQMVEIAKALRFEANVVVMDEPTSALNARESDRLFGVIGDLQRAGCGILYVSHRMEEIYRLASRISVLRDGTVVSTETPEALPPAKVAQLMVGDAVERAESKMETSTAPMGEVVFEARNITVRQGSRTLVDNISVMARPGEVVGLAGVEGSGCSELLWAIFGGIDRDSAGEVLLQGTRRHTATPQESVRAGLALVTNDRKTHGLILGSSVVENCALPNLVSFARRGWIVAAQMRTALTALCRSFSVRAESYDVEVGSLSGGNQQKVVLAKWHQTDPAVLLLDEPTRGIDVNAKAEVYEQIGRWQSAGKAILLITSDIHELLALSDRIVVLRQGRIAGEFKKDDATAEKVIGAAISA